jgi:WD40 repeat protein
MLATIGWSRRGASEVKLYSPSNEDNDKNNNNGIGYAETSSSSSNGEKNSKIQSNEINCAEWSKSNGNCVAVGLSDGRVVVLDKQLKCVGEVKEEERKRQRFKRENDDLAEKTKMHKNTPLTFAAENPARDEDVDDDDFEVKSMDFHSSSRYLLVGGTSNIVKVWDLKTRRVASRLVSSGGLSGGGRRSASTAIDSGVVNAVKFSKDDRVIACGSERGEIVLHKGGERFGEEEDEESFGLGRGKEFNKYYSEPLSAFDVNEEKSMMSTSSSSSSSVKCLDFSPHRRMMLAAGTSRGDLNVYDCESESLETSFHSSDANNVIRSIAFSPTAPRIIAVANDDGSVSLRDVAMHPKTGVCLHIPNPNKRWMQSSSENGVIFGTAGAASSVSWHPSGQALAVGYRGNGVVSMYDCRSLRTHMDERSNKYRSTRMNGFSNSTSGGAEFYSGDDFETRCLFETEAHEGGRVIGLKWQPPPATKAKTKTTNEENDSDKENRIESNVPRKQEQKRHLNKQEEERATAEEMRKSLEILNTTTTTQEQQQQQVLITADAISDEVSKRTKDVVKTCLEKEVKSLKADVRNLHLELLRAQEENATMFRKLHEQHLELMDALSSINYSSKINGKY